MYRIYEKPYRDEDTGKIHNTYYAQEFTKKLFGGEKWRNVQVLNCYGMDCYKSALTFSDKDKACEWYRNMQESMPTEGAITCKTL